LLILALGAALFQAASAQVGSAQTRDGFVLIAHPGVAVTQLSKDQVSQLFLKKTRRWPDDSSVFPVDNGDRDVFEAFCVTVHGRSHASITSYWQRQVFTGRAVPPLSASSDQEVLDYVSAKHGAIGYVSAGTSLKGQGVKRIEIL
jgi:ABC-type phosphate transport system substrate-binding protein